jgi:DNA-binding MarR family transcriptional regulator
MKTRSAHSGDTLRLLHRALIDVVGVMNAPQRDELLIREAGIALDRALFPLLVLIGRFGPIGVVELANRLDRDYTTVSRQVTRLESLGLARRRRNAADRRVRASIATAKGRAAIARLDAARERIGGGVLAQWDEREIEALARLLRKFADAIIDEPARRANPPPSPPLTVPPPARVR